MVRGFGIVALVFFFAALVPSPAQINGVPASVTSMNFGGHFNPTPGVPASVTSLGPRGFTPTSRFFATTLPSVEGRPRRHHRDDDFFSRGGGLFAVPVPYPVPAEPMVDETPDEQYYGGPTIFDRRGPGTPMRSEDSARRYERNRTDNDEVAPAPAAPEPVPDQPQTALIFKDGHTIDVQNYAVVGDTLFDLTPGHRRKIALAELDLEATAKQNDERGIDFQVPATN